MKRRGIFAGESHAYGYYTCKCLVTCKAHERHKKHVPTWYFRSKAMWSHGYMWIICATNVSHTII